MMRPPLPAALHQGAPPRRRAPEDELSVERSLLGDAHPHQPPPPVEVECVRAVGCITGGSSAPTSRRQIKLMMRSVCSLVNRSVRSPLPRWSNVPISFSQEDHPGLDTRSGQLAIITSPTINNYKVNRTLLDGGSCLNLLNWEVFERLQVSKSDVKPGRPFSGVGPGLVVPMGCVSLPVTFGTRENFRTEVVEFEVTHFDLPYNAILGRPAINQFMMAIHYAYLVVKMPGPAGVIKVEADLKGAVSCVEQLYSATAEGDAGGADAFPARRPRLSAEDDVAAKEIPLFDDGSKTVKIGGTLDPK